MHCLTIHRTTILIALLVSLLCLSTAFAQVVAPVPVPAAKGESLVLDNGRVRLSLKVENNLLTGERLEASAALAKEFGTALAFVETDGGFGAEVMYTGWEVPGKANNAENPVLLGNTLFRYERSESTDLVGGAKSLTLSFKGIGHSIVLKMMYTLDAEAFYVHRSIALRDTSFGHHFLRSLYPRTGLVVGVTSVLNPGGFGQPVAVQTKNGSAFFGVEYPAADNTAGNIQEGKSCVVTCGYELGKMIGAEWIESEPTVMALAPGKHVKQWFFTYLDRVRVTPLRPYALYNTWYDLRSPDYPRVPISNVMSEQSAMKMVRLLRENMIEKHGIKLDAFVLDDGWDLYKSDWVLRKEQWPNGLRPLAQELAKTNTDLGVWFGPTGGYSFRKYRLDWMRANGYEIVGDQLCVGGTKYSSLLKQRTTDFVAKEGVGYFKWDGIQFSCSEPTHGHATDIYSRHAIMESVAGLCRSVREKNPNTFLNITSGTWMSPWWVKHANTIWMQGEDYGYADVPSLSQRDGAITYRDFVLYEDLKLKNLWFPIANLMTHGIIKGKLEMLGSPVEPLDKFTNDVLLYFARGVSMYELYISPDILSDGEWNSISQSIQWARDRFPLLMRTEMIGGNPLKREAYGYAHVDGRHAIVALRNPFIEPASMTVEFSPEIGFDPVAEQLVVERVYPTRWVSTAVYRAGDSVKIPLSGYETAVYEVYPLREAKEPLFAGAVFSVDEKGSSRRQYTFSNFTGDGKLLNADRIPDGRRIEEEFKRVFSDLREEKVVDPVATPTVKERKDLANSFEISLQVNPTSREGSIAILVTPDEGSGSDQSFKMMATVDGHDTEVRTELQEGRSQWFSFPVIPGRHNCALTLRKVKGIGQGLLRAQAWYVGRQAFPKKLFEVSTPGDATPRIVPPTVIPPGETVRHIKLGDVRLEVQ